MKQTRNTKRELESQRLSIPDEYLIREPGWRPPGHWLWPTNLLDALLRWHDGRTQARYAKKGY